MWQPKKLDSIISVDLDKNQELENKINDLLKYNEQLMYRFNRLQ